MEILGYVGALFIGLSLGLSGSGGSILTVPILVYFMGLNPLLATSYSLFVVGITSLVGGIRYQQQGLVCWKTVFLFGVPSLIVVYVTRLYLLPALPATLISFPSFTVSKEMFLMVFFAGLMVWAASNMLLGNQHLERYNAVHPEKRNKAWVLAQAIGVSLLSGLVGAGGGFLIIPSLVIFLRLSIKKAVGTSLVLISLNSLVGFIGDLSHFQVDWPFLLTFSGLSILGIWAGSALAPKIDNRQLKKGFAIFVPCMGVLMLGKEILR